MLVNHLMFLRIALPCGKKQDAISIRYQNKPSWPLTVASVRKQRPNLRTFDPAKREANTRA